MSEERDARSAARAAAALAHDVGKYVARAARNVGDASVAAPIADMLVRDLYATDGKRRASAIVESRRAELGSLASDPRLARVAELLAEVDRLEPSVRAKDDRAVRGAAAIAREVESLLRDLARAAAEAAT